MPGLCRKTKDLRTAGLQVAQKLARQCGGLVIL
jgi:hypothetical protein